MITPSGRFEIGVKICLSMSSHHPEHWQPSWSVRVALVALIAFLPTSGHGAIGSLVSALLNCCSVCAWQQGSYTYVNTTCSTLHHLVTFLSLISVHLQDFTKDERRALALQSRKAPPTHGSEAKQSIINSLHMRMLAADKVSLHASGGQIIIIPRY